MKISNHVITAIEHFSYKLPNRAVINVVEYETRHSAIHIISRIMPSLGANAVRPVLDTQLGEICD